MAPGLSEAPAGNSAGANKDDKASIAAIHRALELGINWIDTAAVYGMGHSEEVVASALKSWSGPRPYIFTKCALRWDAQGYVHNNLQAKSIRRECEDSLRRLGYPNDAAASSFESVACVSLRTKGVGIR